VPPWSGELELIDAESGEKREIEFDDQARAEYTRAFDGFARGLQQLALRGGGRFVSFPTSKTLEEVLFDSMVRTRGVA